MFKLLFLFLLFYTNIYAYADMSQVADRANDLNMLTEDYVFSMAISGVLTGTMLGLFLWKAK